MKRTPFKDLTSGFSAEQRQEVEVMTRELLQEMSLTELRTARRLTQETMAAALGVGQPAVAKLEKRTDMYVSNLRRFIEAAGGTLEMRARFPDGDVTITNFAEIGGDVDPETDDEVRKPIIGGVIKAMMRDRTSS